jgi:uncharacterized repeat protein (TIGR02543 family)
MTIYTDQTSEKSQWAERFNSSFRPVVWGCVLSEDNTYVVSVTITENTFSNENSKNGFAAPERDGYVFAGWATEENGAVVYSAADVAKASQGETLYAVWTQINE